MCNLLKFLDFLTLWKRRDKWRRKIEILGMDLLGIEEKQVWRRNNSWRINEVKQEEKLEERDEKMDE